MVGERYEGELRVRHRIFASRDESFAVLAAEDESDGGEVIVAGPLGHLEIGARARFAGVWVDHPRYGPQLEVDDARILDPDDEEGAREYLESIRGIGPRRAARLIEAHGPDLFEAIDRDPEAAFGALSGVSRTAAREAAESWLERRAIRDLYVELAPHGLGRLAPALSETYGSEAMEVVRSDPYRLTELHGVGFLTADRIARQGGIRPDDPRRQEAAALHVLTEAEAEGHTHLPVGELVARTGRLAAGLPEERIAALRDRGAVVVEDGRVWRADTHETEVRLAAALADLAGGSAVHDVSMPLEPRGGLTEEQWRAVGAAFRARLSLVTGGPGTGKSTLVKEVVARARAAGLTLSLCAPTGRAARRLEEATGAPARTVHRLLEWVPGEGPARDADSPVEAELVLCDEASMLNLAVCARLLEAIGPRTHLVLVGDADQLPPVGAGKPFSDLIESAAVPVVRLDRIFRQASRSMIVTAAHAINRGEVPPVKPGPGQEGDFFVLAERDAGTAGARVVDLAADRLPRHYGLDPIREVQVLAPVYRGDVGVDALNRALADRLNPGTDVAIGDLRIGDKAIQTRNDYETGLMNGQICVVESVDERRDELVLETDEGVTRVPRDRAGTLRPAYAISVHKSQGAEVPCVVVALHLSHSVLLSRNLLYTAVSRARRLCVIVGDPAAIARAVARADARRRHSRIAHWVATAGGRAASLPG